MTTLHKPPRLQLGDCIGVISPAAAVQADKLQRGCHALESLGFRVRIGTHVLDRHRFLAGTDAERAQELSAMFHDPDIQAIFCSRAGYGSGRLLPLLDLQTLRQQPKIFLGYSDVTLLLNAFVQRSGFVCFHGPLVSGEFAEDFSPRSQTHLVRLLTEGKGEETLAFPTVLQPPKIAGVAEGRLLGGCLSMLVATLGTPFVIDTTDCVLFIEDVGERPYRVDRMLTQLKQAGKLERLAGVIFGEMSKCWEAEEDVAPVHAVIQDIFTDYSYPVGFGLPAGHDGENFALPLGTRVRLDMEQQELRFLETAVA